jgi:hypothetical protein
MIRSSAFATVSGAAKDDKIITAGTNIYEINAWIIPTLFACISPKATFIRSQSTAILF